MMLSLKRVLMCAAISGMLTLLSFFSSTSSYAMDAEREYNAKKAECMTYCMRSLGRSSEWCSTNVDPNTMSGCFKTFSPSACPLPWGGSIASGQAVTAYQSDKVIAPASCVQESRTCVNGILKGKFKNQSCYVEPDKSCDLPWGGKLAHNASVTAYQYANVVSPATCVAETRTCNSNNLSGSYTSPTCDVTIPPAPAPSPDPQPPAGGTGFSCFAKGFVIPNKPVTTYDIACWNNYVDHLDKILAQGKITPEQYSKDYNDGDSAWTQTCAQLKKAGSTYVFFKEVTLGNVTMKLDTEEFAAFGGCTVTYNGGGSSTPSPTPTPPPPTPQPEPPAASGPAGVLNGKTLSLMFPIGKGGGSWYEAFTVTGYSDRIVFAEGFVGACTIRGPGDICSWDRGGNLGGDAEGKTNQAIDMDGSNNIAAWQDDLGGGRGSWFASRAIRMLPDGSLKLYSYYQGDGLSFYQSGTWGYYSAERGVIPASQLKDFANGSTVTWSYETAFW